MVIICDTREKRNQEVLNHFDAVGQPYRRDTVYAGDYMAEGNERVVVELKGGLLELCGNLKSTKGHARFVAEIERVKQRNGRMVVLIREEKFKHIAGVKYWKSKSTKVTGESLMKTMYTIASRYKIWFEFCTRNEAGKRIIEILSGKK